jgi:hypothetical protein
MLKMSSGVKAFFLKLAGIVAFFLFLAPKPTWAACIDMDVRTLNLKDAAICMLTGLDNTLITAAPLVGAILLIYGALRYAASGGDPKAIMMSKKFITFVLVGMLFAVGAVFVFRILLTILGASSSALPF